MTTSTKPELYNQLKAAGRPLSRSYQEYTVAQLEEELAAAGLPTESVEAPQDGNPPADFFGMSNTGAEDDAQTAQTEKPPKLEETPVVVSEPDPKELPGQRLNTNSRDDVIRVDERGRKWHQEEVRKPAHPKPRGRRVLKYMDSGVRTETVQNGEYVETFEVSGNEASRPAEVKITLPSYQVGIYTDPRFPFKIHCYDGREGFDLQDVQEYYGGSEMVPETCKRIYVSNDLCYDIRSVIRTIQAEHRQLQLTGRIK